MSKRSYEGPARYIEVDAAVDALTKILESSGNILLKRADYLELMSALEAFGMKATALDSAKLKRVKQAWSKLPKG